jgi:hypothetical protein
VKKAPKRKSKQVIFTAVKLVLYEDRVFAVTFGIILDRTKLTAVTFGLEELCDLC